MRRIIIMMILLVSAIFSVFAGEDIYSYAGSAQGYSTATTSFTASIDKNTWLKESATSSDDSSFVYYGFYTDSSSGDLTLESDDSGTSTPTLVFGEEMIEGVSGDYYQGTAKFTIFFYIISNSSYKATLTWSNLSTESTEPNVEKSLSVSMRDSTIGMKDYSSGSLDLKGNDNGNLFNPANKIYQKIERTIEAKTQTYSLENVGSAVEYTGWMKLTLETVS